MSLHHKAGRRSHRRASGSARAARPAGDDTRIGKATAATLLAEMPEIRTYRSARQAAAFAGLAPRRRESGSSVRGRARLSKIGSSRLRRALYFPAVAALRFNPLVRRWGEGLSERGKCKLVVIGAAMRKLVHLAYGVLKTGKPFDAEWAKAA
jgi:transposase